MIETILGMADNVVAVNATGTVTAEDYERILIPLIEGKLRVYDKVRVLYQIGPGFDSFTGGAMWDDAKIGLKHLSAYEKIAVVTDVGWVAGAVKFFAFMIPCPVRVFGNDWLNEAKRWINE